MILKETFTLSNGTKIPKIGFGTWQINPGGYEATMLALKNGYIHIDTAEAYGNEADIGRAIKDFKIPRNQVYITTKLPANIKDGSVVREHLLASLQRLGVDYVDLYLIHAPWPWNDQGADYKSGNIAVWKEFVKLYQEGLVKAIGVSNFAPWQIDYLVAETNVYPHVNQIPLFIGVDQKELREYSKKHQILVEAYSPLATGKLLEVDFLVAMAQKYQVTVAQLCIKFCLQIDTLPLPKSTNEARIINNAQMDFVISEEDMEVLLNSADKIETHLRNRVK
jgi:diketogulonate reductase-like aldo/keto reductase